MLSRADILEASAFLGFIAVMLFLWSVTPDVLV